MIDYRILDGQTVLAEIQLHQAAIANVAAAVFEALTLPVGTSLNIQDLSEGRYRVTYGPTEVTVEPTP